eukprot:RCo029945
MAAELTTAPSSSDVFLTLGVGLVDRAPLEAAFHRNATNGELDEGSLAQTLRDASVQCTSEVAALEILREIRFRASTPERSWLDLEEFVEVARALSGSSPTARTLHSPSTTEGKSLQEISVCSRLGHFLKSICPRRSPRSDQVFGVMKPTTKLVLVVAVMSLVMCLAVAGTAIGVNFINSIHIQEETLKKELRLVLNAVESFTVTQARQQALEKQLDTVVMIADMVQTLGYENMITTIQDRTQNALQAMAAITDQLFLSTSNTLALQRATAIKDHLIGVSRVVSGSNVDMMVALVDLMNREQLPDGYEAMLVRNSSSGAGVLDMGNGAALLSQLRYCNHSTENCSLSEDILSAAINAISGEEDGSSLGESYTGEPAFIAHCSLPDLALGLVYSIPFRAVQASFLTQVVDGVYVANLTNEVLDMVVEHKFNPGVVLTGTYEPCTVGSCAFDRAGAAALQSETQISMGLPSYDDSSSMVIAWEMPYLNASYLAELEMSSTEAEEGYDPWANNTAEDIFLRLLAKQGTLLNAKLSSTTEFLVVQKVLNGTREEAIYVSELKFGSECEPNCGTAPGTSEAPVAAALRCINGTGLMRDYRNKLVLAATVCLPQLNIGLIFKIDDDTVVQQSIDQATVYANAQNRIDDSTLELMIGRPYPSTSAVGSTVQFVSDLEQVGRNCSVDLNSTQCVFSGEGARVMAMALRGGTGIDHGSDYLGHPVYSAYAYSSQLKVGLMLKVDRDEVEWPLFVELLIVLFTAVGITAVGMGFLVPTARHMLHVLEDSWERGKQAVEQQ